jgi:hypothetical protein
VAKSPPALAKDWLRAVPTAFWLGVMPLNEVKVFCDGSARVRNTSLASYDKEGVRKAKLLLTPE